MGTDNPIESTATLIITVLLLAAANGAAQDLEQSCFNTNCPECPNSVTQLSVANFEVYDSVGQFWCNADVTIGGEGEVIEWFAVSLWATGEGYAYYHKGGCRTYDGDCSGCDTTINVRHLGLGATPTAVLFKAKTSSVGGGVTYCGCESIVRIPVNVEPLPLELGPPPCLSEIGDPIDARSGNVYYEQRDGSIGSWSGLPIIFSRSYNSGASIDTTSILGPKWTYNFNYRIRELANDFVEFSTATGQVFRFKDHYYPVGLGKGYQVSLDSASGRYTVRRYSDGKRFIFTSGGLLDTLADRNYGRLHFSYTGDTLTQVTDAAGRYLTFHYNANGKLQSLLAMNGDTLAAYEYDAGVGDTLMKVTYSNGEWESYHYTAEYTAYALLDTVTTSDSAQLQFSYNTSGAGTRTSLNDSLNVDSVYSYLDVHYNYYAPDTVFYVMVSQGSETVTYESILTSDSTRRVHAKVTNSSCNCGSTFEYDDYNQISNITYDNGRTDSLNHGAYGRLDAFWRDIGGPDERRTLYGYGSPFYLLTSVSVPSLYNDTSAAASFTRDSNGNVTAAEISGWYESTRPYVDSATFTYGTNGELLLVDGPRTDVADTTAYRYYANGDLRYIIRSNGDTTEFGALDNLGNLTWIKSPNGDTTRYVFDDYGRMIKFIIRAGQYDSLTTSYERNYAGHVTKVTYPNSNYVDYVYDENGLLIDIENEYGEKIHYAYDLYSRPISQTLIDTLGDTVTIEHYSYDAAGRLTRVTNADSTYSTFDYDNMNNLLTATDPEGNYIGFRYDLLNRLDTTWRVNGGQIYRTLFDYDANNNVTHVIDPDSNEYRYAYSDNGLLMYDSTGPTGVTRYAYDPSGNLTAVENATDDSLSFVYDALNRLAKAAYPDSQNVEYQYDGTEYLHGRGRLYREITPACTTTFRYNQYGHLMTEYRKNVGDTLVRTTWYHYDLNGNLTRITYPSGYRYYYTYDNADRVTMITWTLGHYALDTLVYDIKYDPFGDATEWTLGNDIVVSQSRNLRYFIDTISTGSDSIVHRVYEFDSVGNVLLSKDLIDSLNDASFSYDSLYQLVSAASSRYPDSVRSYDYSSNGNRVSMVVNTGAAQDTTIYEYEDNKLVRMIDADTTFVSYDPVGNITCIRTSNDSTTYQYNDAGQLVSVNGGATAQYSYDGRSRRIQATVGATGRYIYYDRLGRVISEFSSLDGDWERDYVYLNGRIVAQLQMHYDGGIESTGGETTMGTEGIIEPPPPPPPPDYIYIYYYHTDLIGTPLVMTNKYGSPVWRARYYPFGELTYEWASATNDLRFPGQIHDRETGLHYNWHRYYDPKTGRYLQPDPIDLAGGMNLYGYAGANPVVNVDPRGLDIVSDILSGLTSTSHAVTEYASAFIGPTRWLSTYNEWAAEQIGSWLPDWAAKGTVLGTGFGEEAVDYWACKYNEQPGKWFRNPSKLGYAIAGSFAALWTEDNWSSTASTLALAYGVRNAGSTWHLQDGTSARTVIDFGRLFRLERHNIGRGAANAPRWHIDALWGRIRHWPHNL